MEIKEIIISGLMVFMLSIILVQAGVPIDYVGAGVMLLQIAVLLFIKTPYFERYLDMRERHRKLNRKELRLD
jgi:membrane protein implicated in regulation of membrane protease activity